MLTRFLWLHWNSSLLLISWSPYLGQGLFMQNSIYRAKNCFPTIFLSTLLLFTCKTQKISHNALCCNVVKKSSQDFLFTPFLGSLTNCYGILLRAVQPQHLQPQNLQLFVVLHIPFRLGLKSYRECFRFSSPTVVSNRR